MGKILKVAFDSELVSEYGPPITPAWELLDVVEAAEETIECVLGRELAIFTELFRAPRARGKNGIGRAKGAVGARFKSSAKIVRF
jgi:hypothetical protein